jgi:hypothetical protein
MAALREDAIFDTQSYGLVIRDTLYAKTVTLPFFAGFTSRRCRQMPTQVFSLPFLGVYFMNESMRPDGDANAGEVRFINDMTIGFSVIIQDNDPVQSELKLDAAFWAIMNGLWRDQYIMNLIDTSAPAGVVTLPDGIIIEGISGGKRKHVWGNTALNNETPIAEMAYEASVTYRATFPPIITDDLLMIHEEIVPLQHGAIPPADEVQRIISVYEFTPAAAKAA